MQLATIYLLVGLVFCVSAAPAEKESAAEEYIPPIQLRSCIPLYCRKSCKQQRYLDGYCNDEQLCTCRYELKNLVAKKV